jgi:hypothetical protein
MDRERFFAWVTHSFFVGLVLLIIGMMVPSGSMMLASSFFRLTPQTVAEVMERPAGLVAVAGTMESASTSQPYPVQIRERRITRPFWFAQDQWLAEDRTAEPILLRDSTHAMGISVDLTTAELRYREMNTTDGGEQRWRGFPHKSAVTVLGQWNGTTIDAAVLVDGAPSFAELSRYTSTQEGDVFLLALLLDLLNIFGSLSIVIGLIAIGWGMLNGLFKHICRLHPA